MSKSNKILTPEYLDWHAKLTGLPSVLTDRIRSSLYKKYKKETGYEPWQLSEDRLINSKPENKVSNLSFPSSGEQCEEKGFRGIDNYDFASPQPWSSPCPICDGKHGNYGLHGSWYRKNGNQLPYDPELVKLYSQDKLEYCLTCNTSNNKLKFAIVA
ncbi:hypothetical protein RhiirA1_452182 [Rhizophagus irregularis]|uniref:Uncharacterized protein n=1 Tax=Rhizophagus irregularis TaxID=588596 RepID=A0A2N0SAH3_9GLOM|nr:hypothetical protein RhiirA1_452182 [Rhizophagus irregularis]